jgi:fructose-bisphosphate aldolase class I
MLNWIDTMDTTALKATAEKLVADSKGIFAADWSSGTITKKFASVGLESTPKKNREYRAMLISTPGLEEYISGVILHDQTTRQTVEENVSFAEYASKKGIMPGIRIDEGYEPFSGSEKEKITKGLETLDKRLDEYKQMGLKFTKWRAPFLIDKNLPTKQFVKENIERMTKAFVMSQEKGMMPIFEPEVQIDGDHTTARCEEVTKMVLSETFEELNKNGVFLSGSLLKVNMVLPGKESNVKASPIEVANATLRVVGSCVPKEIPGIVFLSGGQSPKEATANLNEINKLAQDIPWKLSFSYARALQMPALEAWAGLEENVDKAQEVFKNRAKLNYLAVQGKYLPDMENG